MIRLPRLYPILDTTTLERSGCPPLAAAEALLEAGARVLQFRHKGHYSRSVLREAGQIAAMCRKAAALFIVNDRADIALLLDAGLHLGQDDLSPAAARCVIGRAAVLGFSTHNEAQLRAALAEPADYLAIGPVFETASKQNPDPVVGIDELRRLRPSLDRPLVAIGGITLDNAAQVFAAGADSIALIGALFAAPCTRAAVRSRAEAWLRI